MRQYERNGVNIDQCTECRGIFLDRGELERLIDSEKAWNGAQAGQPAVAMPAPSGGPAYQRPPARHSDDDDHRRYDSHGYGHKKKKRSFLEDLFD
jgi:Zn-finger nucleic acid-binding protein